MGEGRNGFPIFIEQVGLVTAEVYAERGGFRVYLVGGRLSINLGRYNSLNECMDEIESLKRLSQSNRFERAVSAAVATIGG